MREKTVVSKMGKRMLALVLALVLCAASVEAASFPNTWKNSEIGGEDLVSVALTQVGYTEGSGERTKYGDWYGLSSYWCAMFVAWCANQAGISTDVIPRTASSTTSMRWFQNRGQFRNSPQYGGSYVPQCGDLIYYSWYGKSSVVNHIGIVLYAENGYVFTIEGNTSVNRLDVKEKFSVASSGSSSSKSPPDYVIVRQHSLNSIYIRGYAHPAYLYDVVELSDFSFLQGMMDLGNSPLKEEINTVVSQGWMKPTSSHTFSPLYGMTRSEFAGTLVRMFGMSTDYPASTTKFSDLSGKDANYDAIMTLRAMGIVGDSDSNQFQPSVYISAASARVMTQRLAAYLGIQLPEDLTFGSASWVSRASIAHAFYQLSAVTFQPEELTQINVRLDGTAKTVSVVKNQGISYLPVSEAAKLFASSSSAFRYQQESLPLHMTRTAPYTYSGQTESLSDGTQTPSTQRVWSRNLSVVLDGQQVSIQGFVWNGKAYLSLGGIAQALGADVAWQNNVAVVTSAAAGTGAY